MSSERRRVLVLTVGILAGPSAGSKIHEMHRQQPTDFWVTMPSTRPDYGMTWTEAQARLDAKERLDLMIEFGREMGESIDGAVSREPMPDAALAEAIRDRGPFDEIVVIDNLRGMKGRFEKKMVESAREDHGIPVHHWEADPPTKQGAKWDPVELRQAFEAARDEMLRDS